MPRDEQWFRAQIDADGILREEVDLDLDPRAAFRVFSQQPTPRARSQTWSQFAERFCDSKVGITTDKHYGDRVISRDAARVVISRDDLRETRLVVGRMITAEDVQDAEAAELRVSYTGLSALAKRCKTVWLVFGEGKDDRAALLLAAVLAGTELGPILYPDSSELVGFKTAFGRCATQALPYR